MKKKIKINKKEGGNICLVRAPGDVGTKTQL